MFYCVVTGLAMGAGVFMRVLCVLYAFLRHFRSVYSWIPEIPVYSMSCKKA